MAVRAAVNRAGTAGLYTQYSKLEPLEEEETRVVLDRMTGAPISSYYHLDMFSPSSDTLVLEHDLSIKGGGVEGRRRVRTKDGNIRVIPVHRALPPGTVWSQYVFYGSAVTNATPGDSLTCAAYNEATDSLTTLTLVAGQPTTIKVPAGRFDVLPYAAGAGACTSARRAGARRKGETPDAVSATSCRPRRLCASRRMGAAVPRPRPDRVGFLLAPVALTGQGGAGAVNYESFTLPNGLHVIYSEDHTTPIVTVDLWYDVGSRNERPGRSGFAHLFEHLMFEGSAHATKGLHSHLIESAGGQDNASTAEDRTNYFATVPSNYLNLVLWLEADRMRSLLINEETFHNQRETVKEERRLRVDNEPYGAAFTDGMTWP